MWRVTDGERALGRSPPARGVCSGLGSAPGCVAGARSNWASCRLGAGGGQHHAACPGRLRLLLPALLARATGGTVWYQCNFVYGTERSLVYVSVCMYACVPLCWSRGDFGCVMSGQGTSCAEHDDSHINNI